MRRGVVSMSGADVQGLIAADKKLVVVDVREPHELRSGRIPSALNMPLGNLDSMAKKLDPNAKIVLVCATGNRSVTAYQKLKAMGFVDLVNLSGGMAAWRGATSQK